VRLSPDAIRRRILLELYRLARNPSRPVDLIALAAKAGIAWPDAANQVIALRKEGMIRQPEFKWLIMLTPEGRRRCEAEFGEPRTPSVPDRPRAGSTASGSPASAEG
jgi:hypothetical protein